MTYALAAAGTGGHVYPALAVADALVDAGVSVRDIVFFGGDRMEAHTVPAAGYDFVGVDIRGLRRSLSRENLTLPRTVRRATRAVAAELTRRRVRAVGVFGGYVSVPVALAARRVGAGVVVHEQNARPGLANRLIAPRAAATLAAFPQARRKLKSARIVGNTQRRGLAHFSRSDRRAKALDGYGLGEDLPVLGVLGGSLGALVLNETTSRLAAAARPGSFAIVHLTGAAHIDDIAPLADEVAVPWVTRAFEPAMEMFYAAADLVLARAGALTVSELMATGTPSVLVPLAATHQGDNAALLAAAGGAEVVSQEHIAEVPARVERLLGDGDRLGEMAEAASRLAPEGAADEMAAVLQEVAGG